MPIKIMKPEPNTIEQAEEIKKLALKIQQTRNANRIKKIIFNDPATILILNDGQKIVSKVMPGEEFSEYWGFCACVMKAMFGSNSAVKNIIDKKAVRNGKEANTESK